VFKTGRSAFEKQRITSPARFLSVMMPKAAA
jgi:hypothetical protein